MNDNKLNDNATGNSKGNNKYVGAHVSASGGVDKAADNAAQIGAKALALFTKNQRQWLAKPLSSEEVTLFNSKREAAGISSDHVLPHDSYLINIGNPELEKREKSWLALLEETKRVEQLGLTYLNFHPGSHLGAMSDEECLDLIAEGMNRIIKESKSAVLVIETTAGQGSNVGYRFEHLSRIINNIDEPSRVGVCIDTCHIFAAGYDLRDKKAYEFSMDEFEKVVGFKWLKGMHLNDAKSAYESRVDRHQTLGNGNLGLDPFRFIMNDSRMDNIPLVLETPDPSLWAREIELLYSFIK